ncbi:MAG TPA: YIP1 family protein [Anaeromyxobacteraceae bacterium]|nr:YIP1 family protein [Anaeromyxobacteraceae bacterium]
MLAHLDVARSLIRPGRTLAAVPSRRSLVAGLAAVTLMSLLAAAVVIPRVDYARAADLKVSMGPGAAEMTPHALEEAVATDVKLARVGAWSKALLVPALRALGIALAAFLAFRVAGGRPTFADSTAVAAIAVLPLALRDLLAIPAALVRGSIPPSDAAHLLPSSLAVLVPPGAPAPLAGAAAGLDLFGAWCAVLLAIGMTAAARVSARRAAVVVAILFVALIAVADVALPALAPRS